MHCRSLTLTVHCWLVVLLWCLIYLLQVDCRRVNRRRAADKRDTHPYRLALWIDKKQIERFAGIPLDIYILRNGAFISYLQDASFESQLPTLPAEVDSIELTWTSTEQYAYKFTDLKSLEPDILYDPLISIPASGFVPKKISVFQLAIPCTRRASGVGSMSIALQVFDSTGKHISGSPLKFHLRKRCIGTDGRKTCRQVCKFGGKCNDYGRCQCKPGYHGFQCERIPQKSGITKCKKPCANGGTCSTDGQCVCSAAHYGEYCQHVIGSCLVPCINGGTCSNYNNCSCPDGFSGQFCQKPICKRWCGMHGRCVSANNVNMCECHRGWRGKLCNKTAKFGLEAYNNSRVRNKLRFEMSSPGSKSSYDIGNHVTRRHLVS